MKAIELLKELKHCEEQHIFFNPHHHPFVLDDINQAIAELEKPPPTSDAVKILCKRYGTSLAKIATDLAVENETLEKRILLLRANRNELFDEIKRLKGKLKIAINYIKSPCNRTLEGKLKDIETGHY